MFMLINVGVSDTRQKAISARALLYSFLLVNAGKCLLAYLSCDHHQADIYMLLNFIGTAGLGTFFFGISVALMPLAFVVLYITQALYLSINICYTELFYAPLHLNYYYQLWWEFVAIKEKLGVLPSLHASRTALIDLPIFLVIVKRLFSCRRTFRPVVKMRIILTAIGCMAAALTITIIVSNSDARTEQKTSLLSDNIIIHRFGLATPNLLDLLAMKSGKNDQIQLENGQHIVNRNSSSATYNIIMIQVESLDANIIDYTWQGGYVAPFLHALSRKAIYFPYTMSYHLAGGTSDCEVSVLNSVEPLASFPTMTSGSYGYSNSLAAMLGKHGFETMAFHGNVGSFYNRNHAYYTMKFDKFYDRIRMGLPEEGWGASDRTVFKFAFNRLLTAKRPFMAYIVTMSSHEPFRLVGNYFHTDLYRDVAPNLVQNYFESISYVDSELQDFISQAKRAFPNTYIFIYGDHTPYVIKTGYKRAAFMQDDKEFEFVPLIIVSPFNESKMEQHKVASFLDIAPSVLTASGVSYSYFTDGEDLLSPVLQHFVPFRGDKYDRSQLYEQARATADR